MCRLKDLAPWPVASGKKINNGWYTKITYLAIGVNDWVYTKALSLVCSFQQAKNLQDTMFIATVSGQNVPPAVVLTVSDLDPVNNETVTPAIANV